VVVILVTPLQLGSKIIEEMFNLFELTEPLSQTTEALQFAVIAIPIIAIIAHIAIVWQDLSMSPSLIPALTDTSSDQIDKSSEIAAKLSSTASASGTISRKAITAF
jgi:hypothetical protein